jgi:hypothetical protein
MEACNILLLLMGRVYLSNIMGKIAKVEDIITEETVKLTRSARTHGKES